MVFDEPSVTLLSDLLLSIPGANGVGNLEKVPGYGGGFIPGPTNVHVTRLVRKSHQFSATSVMIWAGQAIVARSFINDLTPLFDNEMDPSDQDVRKIADLYCTEDLSYILLSAEATDLRVFTQQTDQHDWAHYGKMLTGGSGAGDFFRLIDPDDEGDYGLENNKGDQVFSDTYWKPFMLDLKFSALQAFSKGQLENAWGGGIETFFMNPDKSFSRVDGVIYTHSFLTIQDGHLYLSPPEYILTKRYSGEDLYLGEIDFFTKGVRYHAVSAVNAVKRPKELDVDELLPNHASYNFVWHVVHIRVPGIRGPILIRRQTASQFRSVYRHVMAGRTKKLLALKSIMEKEIAANPMFSQWTFA